MVQPDTVDEHPRRQRVSRINDSLGQFQPSAADSRCWQRTAAEDFDKAARDFRTGPLRLAAHLHSRKDQVSADERERLIALIEQAQHEGR